MKKGQKWHLVSRLPYNMVAAGQAVLACGENVRPGAVKAKSGSSQRSKKPNK
jgi:hypothetical protein